VILDLHVCDLTPFLKHHFVCLLNIFMSSLVVDTNPLVLLGVSWSTHIGDVILQYKTPWARISPEVLDRGQKSSEIHAMSGLVVRLNDSTHFLG
jgi:hypothetical protein